MSAKLKDGTSVVSKKRQRQIQQKKKLEMEKLQKQETQKQTSTQVPNGPAPTTPDREPGAQDTVAGTTNFTTEPQPPPAASSPAVVENDQETPVPPGETAVADTERTAVAAAPENLEGVASEDALVPTPAPHSTSMFSKLKGLSQRPAAETSLQDLAGMVLDLQDEVQELRDELQELRQREQQREQQQTSAVPPVNHDMEGLMYHAPRHGGMNRDAAVTGTPTAEALFEQVGHPVNQQDSAEALFERVGHPVNRQDSTEALFEQVGHPVNPPYGLKPCQNQY